MKYYQGAYGIWMVGGDTDLYMGTGVRLGIFKIEKCMSITKFAEREITRQDAIEFCSKWPEAIAKINELDQIAKVQYFDELDQIAKVQYFDGFDGDFWLMTSDNEGWYCGCSGRFVEPSRRSIQQLQLQNFKEIDRKRALEIANRQPFQFGVDLIDKCDPVVTFVKGGLENPHTDLEQLEIVKGKIAGLKFRRTDAAGVTTEHEGPFDFVNFRYKGYEPTPDLEKALDHFLEITGINKLNHVSRYLAEVNGEHIDLGVFNFERLQKALRCYRTNKGQ